MQEAEIDVTSEAAYQEGHLRRLATGKGESMNARLEDVNVMRALAQQAARELNFRPLHDIWLRLTAGAYRVVDTFVDDQRCYLVMTERAEQAPAIRPTQRAVLELVLRGSCQKLVAIDFNLSSSTIATMTKQTLARLGVDCIPSRVPLAIVMAAQACDDVRRTMSAGFASFEHAADHYHVVHMGRPDADLGSLFSPAELQVLRARVEGNSHRVIAGLRRTSPRTVANQLASISRRLGVSGRLETINRLLAPDRRREPHALAS